MDKILLTPGVGLAVSAHVPTPACVPASGPRAVAPAAPSLQGTALPAARLRAGVDVFGVVVDTVADVAPPARGAPV